MEECNRGSDLVICGSGTMVTVGKAVESFPYNQQQSTTSEIQIRGILRKFENLK